MAIESVLVLSTLIGMYLSGLFLISYPIRRTSHGADLAADTSSFQHMAPSHVSKTRTYYADKC